MIEFSPFTTLIRLLRSIDASLTAISAKQDHSNADLDLLVKGQLVTEAKLDAIIALLTPQPPTTALDVHLGPATPR